MPQMRSGPPRIFVALSVGLLTVVLLARPLRLRLLRAVQALLPPPARLPKKSPQPLPSPPTVAFVEPSPVVAAAEALAQPEEKASDASDSPLPPPVLGEADSADSITYRGLATRDRALSRGRSTRGGLRTADDRKMLSIAPFSPALAHWELAQKSPEELQRPSAWEFDAAMLFVDISGFTNLCTLLDIDALQRHINCYFGELIEVVTSYGGDVLRFAGDALYCAWALNSGALEEGTLALATQAACRCALELTDRCGTYSIPEVRTLLHACGLVHAMRPCRPNRPPPSTSHGFRLFALFAPRARFLVRAAGGWRIFSFLALLTHRVPVCTMLPSRRRTPSSQSMRASAPALSAPIEWARAAAGSFSSRGIHCSRWPRPRAMPRLARR